MFVTKRKGVVVVVTMVMVLFLRLLFFILFPFFVITRRVARNGWEEQHIVSVHIQFVDHLPVTLRSEFQRLLHSPILLFILVLVGDLLWVLSSSLRLKSHGTLTHYPACRDSSLSSSTSPSPTYHCLPASFTHRLL